MWVRPGTTWLSLPSLARLLYHTISACVVLTAHGVSSSHGYKISSDSILLCSSRAYLLVYVQQRSMISLSTGSLFLVICPPTKQYNAQVHRTKNGN